jgi:dTDP-4-amino-4,6-dideoxygalactose transaminase
MQVIEYENLHKVNLPFLEEYRAGFEKVLAEGWFILGERVSEFEQRFADYCSTDHCVGVANGFDAITLSLKAFNFDDGSEVLVPANTYIATILAVLHAGLRPVLVEPDIFTYNIDPAKIEESITAKTVAMIAVHLYGRCCDMERLSNICKTHNIKLIEDCAQAHGAAFKNKRAGSFGDAGTFSFYPTKNLGALGDGGCVTTNSSELARIIKMYRNYGSERKYYNEINGCNSRLDELQAAFLQVKLNHLEKINDHKRSLAKIYYSRLKSDFILPMKHNDYIEVHHIFPIRHEKRDRLREYLLHKGIKTEIHYPIPPYRQTALRDIFAGKRYPVSDEIHATVLSLPISSFHSLDDIGRVTEVLNRF